MLQFLSFQVYGDTVRTKSAKYSLKLTIVQQGIFVSYFVTTQRAYEVTNFICCVAAWIMQPYGEVFSPWDFSLKHKYLISDHKLSLHKKIYCEIKQRII